MGKSLTYLATSEIHLPTLCEVGIGITHHVIPRNAVTMNLKSHLTRLDCQGSYWGWIVLPIEKTNDLSIVQNAYSYEFRKPEEGIGPLTLDQAKELARKTRFKTEKDFEPSVGKWFSPTVGTHTFNAVVDLFLSGRK